jgi:hypothetical protein
MPTDGPTERRSATIGKIADASLRMMAGAVSPDCQRALREIVHANPEQYPWERVIDIVLAEPADPSELANRALVAQRKWILRSSGESRPARSRPNRSLSVVVKTWIAIALVRGGFQIALAAVFVVLLLVLKSRWPRADVYRILDWLRETLPGLFGRG